MGQHWLQMKKVCTCNIVWLLYMILQLHTQWVLYIYIVSQNILNIFDCNLKKDYRILIIFTCESSYCWFYVFFGDFGLRDTFQERIAPKPIEINTLAAYEIFSIECRFKQSKSLFSRFKETCARRH